MSATAHALTDTGTDSSTDSTADNTADNTAAQLPLYKRPRIARPIPAARPQLCAGCREKEARYGFRDEGDPIAARPRTLCFECFRVEIGRRQAVAAQLARGWNAQQARLPLDETMRTLSLRRRRAQIAARHAIGQ
jgi:hypothetical protein